MPAAQIDVSCPAALAYELAEEARLLLLECAHTELVGARRAAAEAAYYLSDTIEPEDRGSLRLLARRQRSATAGQDDVERAGSALCVLVEASAEVEQLLRGPHASSELRIALRALRRSIESTAAHIGLVAGLMDARVPPNERLRVLRHMHTRSP